MLSCCGPQIPVGPPRPTWVSDDKGQVFASITGNPNFGLAQDEVMNLIACKLERAPDELALFWVWFNGDQEGVLFTEANFLNSTDHSLQLVDYSLFDRNAGFPETVFSDPCQETNPSPPACSATMDLSTMGQNEQEKQQQQQKRRHLYPRVFGPHALLEKDDKS
jgi:hypothetical protein